MRYLLVVLMMVLSGQVAAAVEAGCAGAEPDAKTGSADPERDREKLKARLQSRLAEYQHVQERLETAIQRLEEGASAAEVRAELEVPGEHREVRGVPPWRHGRHRLTEEERAVIHSSVQQHTPDLAARYEALREENVGLADRMLARMEPRLRLYITEDDERMRELRKQEMRASWDVLDATRAFAAALRAQEEEAVLNHAAKLRSELRQHFDLRQAMHQREVEILEKRLADLREEMDEHLAKREEFIERRIEGVTRAVRRSQSEDGSEEKRDEEK